MELHKKGWQVYRAYIDEHIDFVLAKYWCSTCKEFSNLEKRPKEKQDGSLAGGQFPTNCCEICKNPSLKVKVRFVQVKTSEGIEVPGNQRSNPTMRATRDYIDVIRAYSFHAKLRSNIDKRSFYAWIALIPVADKLEPHYYIFHHKEIDRFDDLTLPSYQKTDNQKITLRIDSKGNVRNQRGPKHDFSCFKEFHNKLDRFEQLV